MLIIGRKYSMLLYPLLLLPSCIIPLIKTQIVESPGMLDNCQLKLSESLAALSGLPFTLDCRGLFEDISLATSSYDVNQFRCLVTSPGFPSPQRSDQPITVESSSSTVTSYNVSLLINETICFRKLVTIEVYRTISQTPFDAIERDVTHDVNLIHRQQKFHEMMTLPCIPPPSAVNGLRPRLSLPTSYTTTWWRVKRFRNGTLNKSLFVNYTKYIYGYSHIARTVKNGNQPDSLKVHSVNFFYPAVYSCEVSHGNKSAFVVHNSVCVLTPSNSNLPISIACDQKIAFVEGETVSILCSVSTSTIRIETGQMEVEWKKKGQNSTLCRNVFNETLPASNPRYTCSINNFPNPEQKCFEYIPDDSEANSYPDRKVFSLQLDIKDVIQSDASVFTVKMRYEQQWSEKQEIESKFHPENNTILENNTIPQNKTIPVNETKHFVVTISVTLSLLLAVAIIILVVWCNWITILQWRKRHFGKHDKDHTSDYALQPCI